MNNGPTGKTPTVPVPSLSDLRQIAVYYLLICNKYTYTLAVYGSTHPQAVLSRIDNQTASKIKDF